ncbi:type VI secretion system tube protein Hcp [Dyella sp.]|uniref:Hcp family type VI secretion system effector n=1 Tax=Dyella sp. TaxID=1869338 RepID=UPI002B4608AD|nr:type VI secretion system tube protein Hcp [Dyella sp.]HKT27460.1 type VI secretion system tube protein Hcp [Dyella sp.]
MAQDIFLRLSNGVKGESQDATRHQDIEVLSYEWDVAQQSNMQLGTGGGVGRPTVGDLVISKYTDTASPDLMYRCLKGQHFDTAQLVVRKVTGANPLEYITFNLEQVMITGYKPTGMSNSDARPTETVRLSFAQVEQLYVPQNDKGAQSGTISQKFNIKQNS